MTTHSKPENDIVARLREDAKHHKEIANDCDCRPEDTINWQHMINCYTAAAEIELLRVPAQGQPKYQAQYNDDFNIATGSSGSLKYVATVTPQESASNGCVPYKPVEALERLASSEAMTTSFFIYDTSAGRELKARLQYARDALTRPWPANHSQEENAVTATAIENVLSDANEGFDDGDPGSDVLNAFAMNGAAAILAKYDVRAKR